VFSVVNDRDPEVADQANYALQSFCDTLGMTLQIDTLGMTLHAIANLEGKMIKGPNFVAETSKGLLSWSSSYSLPGLSTFPICNWLKCQK